MSIERLSGGLTPADGSDPRTFPEIFNGFADEFEEVQTRGFRFVETVYFDSNGTFSKGDYPWLRAIRVKVQGAGGSGGGCPATGSNEFSVSSGGDAGGHAESFITNIAGVAASVTVTCGAGGSSVTNDNGNSGGSSSFGTSVVAGGGFGGRVGFVDTNGNVILRSPTVGNNAGGTSGTLLSKGGKGLPGVGNSRFSGGQTGGHGGDSVLSSGGGGGIQGTGRGGSLGSGGGGSGRPQNAGAAGGGSGGDGIVIVELFA